MKTLPLSLLLLTSSLAFAQTDRVGIGTTTPRAGLDVTHNDGILATGILGSGSTTNLPTGQGTRLMWIPRKAAFRAGHVSNSQWDDSNIGIFSVAMGHETTASGDYSSATGYAAIASGNTSTATGFSTNASGDYSMAMGYTTNASGNFSTAMGSITNAIGNFSTAMGSGTQAIGDNSTAMGYSTNASGSYSTALGNRVSTNDKTGSFIIGDGNVPVSPNARLSDVNHQFKARFTGGYVLVTDNTGGIGAKLDGGQSAWSVISDSTKKEGFRPADGQAFLQKIAQMRLGSWNYKGQDAATMRHYGPMAQDFFAAFGRDGVGTVGNETTINQADFDGVNLIAIKALVEKTERLEMRNDKLEAENAELRRLLGQVVADVQTLKTQATATASR